MRRTTRPRSVTCTCVIVEELSSHEAVEQEVVFPAFHAAFVAGGDDTLAHRIGEHEELNETLAEMSHLAPDCFAFIKRGSALLLELKGHFLIEEETVFTRMPVRNTRYMCSQTVITIA